MKMKRYVIKKAQYFLMRHQFPLSREESKALCDGSRIFANSIPKAGTNMLTRVLEHLPLVIPRWTYHLDETVPGISKQLDSVIQGQIVSAHFTWSKALINVLIEREFIIYLIIRDPRDVILSGVHYVAEMDKQHRLHKHFRSLGTMEKRITAYIKGVDNSSYISKKKPKQWYAGRMCDYVPWTEQKFCHVVRFEDLVGEMGGGSDDQQYAAVKSIIDHAGLNVNHNEIKNIASKVYFEGSKTFRKGVCGEWRKYFTEEHRRIFFGVYGDLLLKLGYEKDDNW